jgi:metal-responsive CopG/Arc/MetJ family transcriptional regulator
MEEEKKNKKFTSVSIPTFLFDKAKERMTRSGFPSVSAYVGYILREILSEKSETEPLIGDDAEKVKNRLRSLGYLDE